MPRAMFRTLDQPGLWAITLSAAGILLVTMGARQSLGRFVSPLNTSTGLGIAAISLAMAVGQFTREAVQPFAGAAADRFLPARVLVAGVLLPALGSAITPFIGNSWGLVVALGLFSAIGSGAGSFSVLIGASSQRLPLEARGAASGVINAGGSLGQFVFAPILQMLIQLLGWMGARWSLAIIGLFNICGSLYAGSGVARYRSKSVLFCMYGSRALLVLLYLAAPKTGLTFYLFAAGLGFTWPATSGSLA